MSERAQQRTETGAVASATAEVRKGAAVSGTFEMNLGEIMGGLPDALRKAAKPDSSMPAKGSGEV